MVRRIDINNPDPVNRDERLGEAIEQYLALSEGNAPPDVEDFSARFPDLGDDLREALEGLACPRLGRRRERAGASLGIGPTSRGLSNRSRTRPRRHGDRL